MLPEDDLRWSTMKGGYKTPVDPRPLIRKLETQQYAKLAWDELWEELHHQGDVGDASYAAVPLLVDMHRKRGASEWDTFALVCIIELARTEERNPEVPAWLADDYFRAIQELAELGLQELVRTTDADAVRAILSVVAVARGLRTHAKFLIQYSEDELQEIESKAFQ